MQRRMGVYIKPKALGELLTEQNGKGSEGDQDRSDLLPVPLHHGCDVQLLGAKLLAIFSHHHIGTSALHSNHFPPNCGSTSTVAIRRLQFQT